MAIGGEHCNTNARARLRTLLERGVRVYHMYGLTEMSVWQSMTSLDTRALATLAASALTSRPAAVAAIKCFKDLQGIEVAEENRVIAQFEVSV